MVEVDVNKLIITQLDKITGLNNAGEVEFIMDELQNGTISNTEEKVDITGKGGRKIASLKKNKAVTVTATNGYIVGGAIAAQTGTDVESGSYKIRNTDIIVVVDKKASTTEMAVGTVGAELGTLYRKKMNGSLGEKLTQVAQTPSAGQFTYDPASKAITFAEGDVENGEELVAFYDIEVTACKISNDSEVYSKVLKIFIDVTAQDNCDRLYHGQFIIPRGNFSGNFDFAMGNDPTTHSIEIESLAGGCTGSSKLWDFIVY